MELLKITSTKIELENKIEDYQKKVLKCPECEEVPSLDIDIKNLLITVTCNNKYENHFNELSYSELLNKCFESSKNPLKCSICSTKEIQVIINANYYCLQCLQYFCPKCYEIHENKKYNHDSLNIEDIYTKCILHKKEFKGYCLSCGENICLKCFTKHEKRQHIIQYYKELEPNAEDNEFINLIIKNKEEQINIISQYLENERCEIIDDEVVKKVEELINLINNKNEEIFIKKLILFNYQNFHNNYFIIDNLRKIIKFEKENSYQPFKIMENSQDIDTKIKIDYIIKYLENEFNFKKLTEDTENTEDKIQIFNDNLKINNLTAKSMTKVFEKSLTSLCLINETFILLGGGEGELKIFDIDDNKIVYDKIKFEKSIISIEKFRQNDTIESNTYSHFLIILSNELIILKIKEISPKIFSHSIIEKINNSETQNISALILEPNHSIIVSDDKPNLSVYDILDNDLLEDNDYYISGYYSISLPNINKDKERITSFLQVSQRMFVTTSSLDLCEKPKIKFWDKDKGYEEIGVIQNVFCSPCSKNICRIDNRTIGISLKYINLREKVPGICLVDLNFKQIISYIISNIDISCMKRYNEHIFLTSGYEEKSKKYIFNQWKVDDIDLFQIGEKETNHKNIINNFEVIKSKNRLIISDCDGFISFLK